MVPMQAAWGFQCAQTFPVYRTTTMDSYLYLDRLHRWSICPNQSFIQVKPFAGSGQTNTSYVLH